MGLLEVSKSDRNNTNNNQTEYNQTEYHPIHPIYPDGMDSPPYQARIGWEDEDGLRTNYPLEVEKKENGLWTALDEQSTLVAEEKEDGLEDRASPETYLRKIRQNIEYEYFLRNLPPDELAIVQEIDQILMDIAYARGGTFRINGAEYSPEYVREKVLSMNSYHIQYILECMKYQCDVRNIRAYMLTTMVNSIATMDHSYQQQMINDGMGGWG